MSLDAVELDRSRIRLPDRVSGPLAGILWRVGVAIACVGLTTLLVYLDRAGYRDGDGHVNSWLDAL